jgi:glyoxylase-like metal-dependent hydrolase (beta-lactamase superfamily II)
MPKIHAIRTGLVKVKLPQMEARGTGQIRLAHVLFDNDWSDWLPIYAWLIEHEEGIIVVDTGETSRVHESGYHPSWHPFFRLATQFSVAPEEEIGPQLRNLGITPRDIRQVVLTHLHTDHAGGLAHFPTAKSGSPNRNSAEQAASEESCWATSRTAGQSGFSPNSSALKTSRSAPSSNPCRSPNAVTYESSPPPATRHITYP